MIGFRASAMIKIITALSSSHRYSGPPRRSGPPYELYRPSEKVTKYSMPIHTAQTCFRYQSKVTKS